ncbi:hypothetical protein GQ457_15G028010 [Hibiscus cannabinus]
MKPSFGLRSLWGLHRLLLGVLTIKALNDVFDVWIRAWQHSLVAQFIGNFPNFGSLQRLFFFFFEETLQRLIKQIWGHCVVVSPHPSAADITSCSHVFASNVNEVVAIGTGLPIEAVGCESDGNVETGSINIVSTELVVGNVVARNVSNVLVNVELVAGVVETSTTLSVDVPYVMSDQSIHALLVASTEVMEPTITAHEASKGIANFMAGNPNISPRKFFFGISGDLIIPTQLDVVRRIQALNVDLVCLIETRVKLDKMQSIVNIFVSNPMKVLFLKLKRLKHVLKAFNMMKYGDLVGRVKNTRAELERILLFIHSGVSIGQLLEQEKYVFLELRNSLRAEESFYRLKKNKQSIKSIFNDLGQSLHTYDQIAEEAIGFFTKLLGVSNLNVSGCSVELLQDILPSGLALPCLGPLYLSNSFHFEKSLFSIYPLRV